MPRSEIRDGSPLARVRSLCLALPGTEQRESHGEPCWFAGGKRTFVMAAQEHHDDRDGHLGRPRPKGCRRPWSPLSPSATSVPRTSGTAGWVGVYLDVDDIDWPHVEELVEDGWRGVAPKRLLAALDAT